MNWHWAGLVLMFSLTSPMVVTFAAGSQVEKIKEPSQFELMKMADQMNIDSRFDEKEKFARFESKMNMAAEEKKTTLTVQRRRERQPSSNTLNSKLGTPNTVKDHTIMTTIWKHEN